MTELIPCPRCGSTNLGVAEIEESQCEEGGTSIACAYFIECSDCGLRGPEANPWIEGEDAGGMWNIVYGGETKP